MQSWVINNSRKLTLISEDSTEFDTKTQAKVKISRACINKSDIASFQDKYNNLPIVPSRSALGFISESTDPAYQKGQRVYLSPYISSEDNKTYIKGKNFDGYLSDFSIVPFDNIFSIPEMIPDEDFTFIEDIAMALKICELLNIKETRYVLLQGATTLNIILGQFALYYQAIPIIIDSDENALSKAEEKGIYYTINSKKDNVYDRVLEITAGALANYIVVDVDTFPEIEYDLLKFAAVDAKIALAGFNTSTEKSKIDISYVVEKRLTIYGINDGIGQIATAINMLATDVINVDGLVEKVYNFDEAEKAFIDLEANTHRFKTLIHC